MSTTLNRSPTEEQIVKLIRKKDMPKRDDLCSICMGNPLLI
jgi:hypothetical protein